MLLCLCYCDYLVYILILFAQTKYMMESNGIKRICQGLIDAYGCCHLTMVEATVHASSEQISFKIGLSSKLRVCDIEAPMFLTDSPQVCHTHLYHASSRASALRRLPQRPGRPRRRSQTARRSLSPQRWPKAWPPAWPPRRCPRHRCPPA